MREWAYVAAAAGFFVSGASSIALAASAGPDLTLGSTSYVFLESGYAGTDTTEPDNPASIHNATMRLGIGGLLYDGIDGGLSLSARRTESTQRDTVNNQDVGAQRWTFGVEGFLRARIAPRLYVGALLELGTGEGSGYYGSFVRPDETSDSHRWGVFADYSIPVGDIFEIRLAPTYLSYRADYDFSTAATPSQELAFDEIVVTTSVRTFLASSVLEIGADHHFVTRQDTPYFSTRHSDYWMTASATFTAPLGDLSSVYLEASTELFDDLQDNTSVKIGFRFWV